MDARKDIAVGMAVYTQDGEKLGTVVDVDPAGLFVDKGLFPKEYGIGYDEVTDVRDDGVYLRLNKQAIVSAMATNDPGIKRSQPTR
jgi:sporulation protein YlmC with PRC-barrel domain